MNKLTRLAVALILLLIAAFCVFGFLATFEPPGSLLLRIVYALVGAFCAVLAVRIVVAK